MTTVNAIRVNNDGYIEEFRQFDDAAPKGWIDIGNQVVSFSTHTKRYVNGKIVDAELIAPVTYQTRRQYNYPSVGDQMDMLWHAMDRGELPKIQPFYAQIKAVKDKYPKPSNNG